MRSQRSTVAEVRRYARQLAGTQFESLADDAGLCQEARRAARHLCEACLLEWGRPAIHFPAGEDSLEEALRVGSIPSGPRSFPFVDNLFWALREHPSDD